MRVCNCVYSAFFYFPDLYKMSPVVLTTMRSAESRTESRARYACCTCRAVVSIWR